MPKPASKARKPSARPAPDQPREVATVGFVSLGCPKNLVDSEKMLGLLAQDGLIPVSFDPESAAELAGAAEAGERDIDTPDAVVVNTCGFLEASKDESLSVIRDAVRLKNAGLIRRVVVAGCLVQRHRAKMLEWEPGIDAMIGVFDRDHIVQAVRGSAPQREARADGPKYWIAANALSAADERGLNTVGLTVNGKDGRGIGYFEDDSARLRLTPRHYAYLRVSEGCNQNCAFCTIPSIRGKMRSKPIERIADEARELIADGAFELILIGQDTTSYGDDIGLGLNFDSRGGGGLPAMLRAVNDAAAAEGGSGWVRLMYAYPSNFTDEMIDAIAQLPRILKYIDMPLQHASDAMLSAMRRNVSAAHQRDLVRRLRERIPGMTIRTTFITGFPGETEDDHRRLLDFVGEARFDAMGVFEYSREDGTRAGTMDADPVLHVPADVKARRKHELMVLQQRIVEERNRAIAGKFDENRPADSGVRVDVLIDRALASRGRDTAGVSAVFGGAGTLHQGRTGAQAPDIDGVTFVQSRERLSPGELVPCVIVGHDGYDLIARPIADLQKRRSLPVLR